MSKYWLILSLLFLIQACTLGNKVAAPERDPQQSQPFSKEVMSFFDSTHPLIQKSLEWRKNSQDFYSLIQMRKQNNEALNSDENKRFYQQGLDYLDLRNRLFSAVSKYRYLVAPNTYTRINYSEKTTHRKEDGKNIYIINPKDQEGKDLLFGFRISLAAALVLYDNFIEGIQPHYEDSMTRDKLKYDTRNDKAFTEIIRSYFSTEQRVALTRAMRIYSDDFRFKTQFNLDVPELETKLDKEILNSTFYNFALTEGDISNPWDEKFMARVRGAGDYLRKLGRESLFKISKTFGNVTGKVYTEKREGRMKNLPEVEKTDILKTLKPFDILLEKTPFKATDNFIPGYYGHVAIYLGTEAQLKQLGLWSHFSSEMREQISKNKTILEALRPGVVLNSLDTFLDIDDLLVVRSISPLSQSQLDTYAVNAKEQFGKKYDFNFDVSTQKEIVCSELAYVVFTDRIWNVKKTLGRFTISPDHVMERALPGRDFEPVLMYVDGRKVTDTLSYELTRLLNSKYTQILYTEESMYRYSQDPQEITHLASGLGSLYSRIEMIQRAQDAVDMEYFIYKGEGDVSSRLLTQELVRAAGRESALRPGQKIKVRLLVDSSKTVLKLKDGYATVLRDNGVQVRYYNDSPLTDFKQATQRNHRKVLIIDGKEAITGGRNIGNEYFDLSPRFNFLDTDLHIKGSMAKAFQDSFEAYWYSPLTTLPNYFHPHPKKGKSDKDYQSKLKSAYKMLQEQPNDKGYKDLILSDKPNHGPSLARTQKKFVCSESTFVSDYPSDHEKPRRVFNTILDVVKKSNKSLIVESPYFVITELGAQVFSGLLKKPRYSISIQTNSLRSTDASYTTAAFYPVVKEWTSRGVQMYIYKGDRPEFLYPPMFKDAVWGTHSKRAVVDEKISMVGTYNVDPRSTNLNNEMLFICHDNLELAQELMKDMSERRKLSIQMDPDGKPMDGSDPFLGASAFKQLQYKIFEKVVDIPFIREQL